MKRLMLLLTLLIPAVGYAQTDVPPPPKPDKVELPPAPPPRPAADKIATVSINLILNGWTKAHDFTSGLEAETAEQKKALADLEANAKEKITMRDSAGLSVKMRNNLQLEIVQLQAKAEYMMKSWNQMARDRLDEGIAKLYDEIRTEVAKYAEEQGITMVYAVENRTAEEDIKSGRADDIVARRPIVFAHKGYDISRAITERLEEKYKKEKAEPPK